MKIRPSLATGVLVVSALALAGCLTEEAPRNSTPPTDKVPITDWQLPAMPKIDAKALLVNHSKFVKTNPYRANNAPGHIAARDYMAKDLAAAGLEVWRQNFTTGIPQVNVCAIKIGEGAPEDWIVVGGHYDTTTWDDVGPVAGQGNSRVSEGAYDDGSGTWITIEIAKAYAHIPTYFSVAFCAFDGEERGLQGSGALFRAMQADDGSFPYVVNSTRAMLDFDMFGICWPVRAPIFFDVNNDELHAKVDAKRKEMKIPDDMFKRSGLSLGQSDYAHWYRANVPTAFFISDFEELGVPFPGSNPAPVPGIPGAYPFWHFTDTVETMTVMAGGADMLQKGFQTATDLGLYTLQTMLDPSVSFEA